MMDLYDLAFAKNISGGGTPAPPPPAEKSDVTLYDFDGTIIAGYTAAEFAGLSALPVPPEHEFLTFTGWNYSLTDAKSYVAAHGSLDIGAVYRVTDGKTRLFITLNDGRLAPTLGLGINGSADIDWGDGTAHGTMTGTDTTVPVFLQHIYAAPGNYIIAIAPSAGSEIAFSYDDAIDSMILIKSSSNTSNESKVYLTSIKKIYIGDSVTSIGYSAFNYCHGLSSIVISDSVTSIGKYAFNYCYGLSSIVIPDSVTSIGNSAFGYCYGLPSIVIPDSVTSIGYYEFRDCCGLSSIVIPDSVTSIGNSTFDGCYGLPSIVIPDSVTSIGNSAFGGCYGLGKLVFEATTPPAVSNANAFNNVPVDCIIYVPTGTLAAYKAAANYPNPNNYTYREY